MKSKMLFRLTVSGAVVAFAAPAARATAVIGATEPTQILNNIQLGASYVEQFQQTMQQIQMVRQQLDQYRNMLQNTRNLTSFDLDDILPQLVQLRDIVASARGLSYAIANIEDRYDATHKGYSEWLSEVLTGGDLNTQLQRWNSLHRETTTQALQSLQLQEDNFADETSTLNALKAKLTTVEGAVQAINVGSELSVQTVQQLQLLRQLMMTQTQMHARYAAIEQDRTDLKAAQTRRLTNAPAAALGNETTF